MYIKKICDVNVGPIINAIIHFPFSSEGNPKPVVIVGENGSGKSALLSNIVDSFYELAGEGYKDVRKSDNTSGYQYYKAITPSEIHIGEEYMYSYIEFQHGDKDEHNIGYLLKSGSLSYESFQKNSGFSLSSKFNWGNHNNYKKVAVDKEMSVDILRNQVLCYFGPNRYERPLWLGEKYYLTENNEHLRIRDKWADRLGKPISVENVTNETLQWLLDIIADSRCDVEYQGGTSFSIANISVGDLVNLGISRKNIETIMGTILGEDIFFGLNLRNKGNSRFNIHSKKTGAIIIPSLGSLSTGQSALFNMFATIIRYADDNDVNNSIKLEKIKGIVVIDEVELHLHSNLQKEILPKLIALFPQVQFIISTHSPLFLLGMDSCFGEDGYEIYQMPNANKITTERFSEFQKAYTYYSQTQTYHEEIKRAISAKSEKALIITEGSTDWKHLKTAFRHITNDPATAESFARLEFEFLEYEPKNSKKDSALLLEMSNSQLSDMCKYTSAFFQTRKLIFIADADDVEICKKLGSKGENFKKWGNGVYSFILPVPSYRNATPRICIEHYYLDEELKTEVEIDGTLRRIYMGNEFDSTGLSNDRTLFCYERNSCGKDKICIIDGSSEKRVIRIDDEQKKNIALPKSIFAEYVLEEKGSFADFDYLKFIPIFEIIKEILEDE